MNIIVAACLSQFHGDENNFELLLSLSDGREPSFAISRNVARAMAKHISKEVNDSEAVPRLEQELATDMLSFLKDFVDAYKGMQDGDGEEAPELARARELIQRAEGRSGITRAAIATPITEEGIDRAAKYLRETKQASQAHLLPWDRVAKSAKKKWLVLAKGTLEAALKND